MARVTHPQDAHLNSIAQVLLKLCSHSSSFFPPRLDLLMERLFQFCQPTTICGSITVISSKLCQTWSGENQATNIKNKPCLR